MTISKTKQSKLPEPPLLQLAYGLCLHIQKKTALFPKQYRYNYGQKILDCSLEVIGSIARANAMRDAGRRVHHLDTAMAALQEMRVLLRLGFDLKCFPLKEYALLTGQVEEAASQILNWQRYTLKRNDASPPQPPSPPPPPLTEESPE